MQNEMERHSIFAVTSVGKNFCRCPPVRSRGPSLDNVVDDNVAKEGVISTATSSVGVHVVHMDEE